MNTQNKKMPLRLNIFDVLLILLAVIIIAAGAVLVLYNPDAGDEEHPDKRVQYTVIVKDMPTDLVINTKPGDLAIDTVNLGPIGEVVSVNIIGAEFDAFNHETQSIVHGAYEDLISAEFTFETDVTHGDIAYQVGPVNIAIGAQIYFRTPSFLGYGYIIDIKDVPMKDTADTEEAA